MTTALRLTVCPRCGLDLPPDGRTWRDPVTGETGLLIRACAQGHEHLTMRQGAAIQPELPGLLVD